MNPDVCWCNPHVRRVSGNKSVHSQESIDYYRWWLTPKWWFLMKKKPSERPENPPESWIIMPYGSKYLLRKCLWYNLLWFGGLSTFSDSVWIHRDGIFLVFFSRGFQHTRAIPGSHPDLLLRCVASDPGADRAQKPRGDGPGMFPLVKRGESQ